LPVGVTFAYAATPDVTVAFGVDLPITLFLYPGPVTEWIAPSFGPGVEIHAGSRLAFGVNTRFGPVIRTGMPGNSSVFNTSGTEFGFVTQLLVAYWM
jgi:hypothetical protein